MWIFQVMEHSTTCRNCLLWNDPRIRLAIIEVVSREYTRPILEIHVVANPLPNFLEFIGGIPGLLDLRPLVLEKLLGAESGVVGNLHELLVLADLLHVHQLLDRNQLLVLQLVVQNVLGTQHDGGRLRKLVLGVRVFQRGLPRIEKVWVTCILHFKGLSGSIIIIILKIKLN